MRRLLRLSVYPQQVKLRVDTPYEVAQALRQKANKVDDYSIATWLRLAADTIEHNTPKCHNQ